MSEKAVEEPEAGLEIKFPDPSEEAVVTAPSGLRVKMRAMRVREEDLLADKKLGKEQRIFDELLSRCVLEVLDGAGIYGAKFDPDKLLAGDHFFLCIALRIMSYGNDYEFKITAPSSTVFDMVIDLRDLVVKPIPEETRQKVLNGEPFEFRLPRCGKMVKHVLLRRLQQRRFLRRVAAEQGRITSAMVERIVEIEGVQDAEKRAFVEGLQAFDAASLRRETEAVDFGVDTAVEGEDPANGSTFPVELEFTPTFFSLPSRSQSRRS